MEVAEGYKVARRRDDDIAIVTAGLRIRTEASPEVARVARASEWAREDGEIEIRNQRRVGGGGWVRSGEGR
jgi:xanthine dehydrogenase iron-sulfur cluster and FAD-binding subunit A